MPFVHCPLQIHIHSREVWFYWVFRCYPVPAYYRPRWRQSFPVDRAAGFVFPASPLGVGAHTVAFGAWAQAGYDAAKDRLEDTLNQAVVDAAPVAGDARVGAPVDAPVAAGAPAAAVASEGDAPGRAARTGSVRAALPGASGDGGALSELWPQLSEKERSILKTWEEVNDILETWLMRRRRLSESDPGGVLSGADEPSAEGDSLGDVSEYPHLPADLHLYLRSGSAEETAERGDRRSGEPRAPGSTQQGFLYRTGEGDTVVWVSYKKAEFVKKLWILLQHEVNATSGTDHGANAQAVEIPESYTQPLQAMVGTQKLARFADRLKQVLYLSEQKSSRPETGHSRTDHSARILGRKNRCASVLRVQALLLYVLSHHPLGLNQVVALGSNHLAEDGTVMEFGGGYGYGVTFSNAHSTIHSPVLVCHSS